MAQEYLKKIYETRYFTDCTFIFPNDEGKQIKVHRHILAEKSSVFHSIFLDLKENSNEGHINIEIKDCEYDVFNDLIRFIYCETLGWKVVYAEKELNGELIHELYIAFDKYKVESGKSYLLDYLKEILREYYFTEVSIQNFFKLANDRKDEDFLELITAELYSQEHYNEQNIIMEFTPQELNQFLCHLNTCANLEAIPCKVLAIVGKYVLFNKNRYVDLTETLNEILETIRWNKAEVADIIGCSLLNKERKIAFLIKNYEMNNINIPVIENTIQETYITRPSSNVAQKDANTETKYTAMTKEVTANMSSFYLNQKYTDCDFEFSTEGTIKAHKLVLSLSSPVFEAMFYGGLAEDSPIIIPDIEKSVFDFLLRLIYLEDISDDLNSASSETLSAVYGAAHKYQCMRALDLIGDQILLRRVDAFLFYELALKYENKDLETKFLEYLKQPLEALETDYFIDADPETICTVFQANNVDPGSMIKLVQGLERYIKANEEKYPDIKFRTQEALKGIQFSKLNMIELLKTSLLNADEKITLFAINEGCANLIPTPSFSGFALLSSQDQDVIHEFIKSAWLLHQNKNEVKK